MILNSLLPEPLQVAWIGNGSDMLVLTDDNSRSGFLSPKQQRLCNMKISKKLSELWGYPESFRLSGCTQTYPHLPKCGSRCHSVEDGMLVA